jgi:hypothetical protein
MRPQSLFAGPSGRASIAVDKGSALSGSSAAAGPGLTPSSSASLSDRALKAVAASAAAGIDGDSPEQWARCEPAVVEPVILCGWLAKRGRVFPTWRRRFFVLRGCDLAYHTSDACMFSRGQGGARADPPPAGPASASALSPPGGGSDTGDSGPVRRRSFAASLLAALKNDDDAALSPAAHRRTPRADHRPRGRIDVSRILTVEALPALGAAAAKPTDAAAHRFRLVVAEEDEGAKRSSRGGSEAAGAPPTPRGKLRAPSRRQRELLLQADSRADMQRWIRVLTTLQAGQFLPAGDG